MLRFLFISVKPEFADKLIEGSKTIELRKNKPNLKDGDYIIIYSTVPIKSVLGFAKVKSIIESTPEDIWNNHAENLGIDRLRFDDYYSGTNRAIGIEINPVCKLKEPIYLREIREIITNFSPPQSYRYFSKFGALRLYNSIIGNN